MWRHDTKNPIKPFFKNIIIKNKKSVLNVCIVNTYIVLHIKFECYIYILKVIYGHGIWK